MRLLLTTILSLLLLTSPLFGQSERPETIVIPVSSLGEVSETRKQILQNSLEEDLKDYFMLISQERFDKAREAAFEELDYEECTEDQCIVLIQEMLQVENVFSLQIVVEGNDTQLSLSWRNLDEKKKATNICRDCDSFELNNRVSILVNKLVNKSSIKEVSGLSIKEMKSKIEEEEAKKQKEEKKKSTLRIDGLIISDKSNGVYVVNTPKINLLSVDYIFSNNIGIGLTLLSIPKIVRNILTWDSLTSKYVTNRTEGELNISLINLSYNFNEFINIYEDYYLSLLLGYSGLYSGYVKDKEYWNDSEEPALGQSYFLHLGLSIPNNYEIYIDRKYLETRAPRLVSQWRFQIISLGLGYKF